MDCKQIHETVISDIKDIITGVESIADGKFGPKKSYSSIAKQISNLTTVFPVLISRSVPIETAQIVTKACERDAVAMLQILFSSMSITNARDGIEYVKSIHNNINLGNGKAIDVDKYMTAMSTLFPANENAQVLYREAYDLIKEDMIKNINHTFEDSISENGLNDYSFTKIGNNYTLLKEDSMPVYREELTVEMINNSIDSFLADKYFEDFKKMRPHIYNSVYTDNIDNDNSDASAIINTPITSSSDSINSNMKTYDTIDRLKNEALNGKSSDAESLYRAYISYVDFMREKDGLTYDKLFKFVLDRENIELMNKKAAEAQENRNDDNKRRDETDKRRYDYDVDKLDFEKTMATLNYDLNTDKFLFDKAKFAYQQQQDEIKNALANAQYQQQLNTDRFNRQSKMLIDTDVKKANEMIPTLMNVTFTQMVGKGSNQYPVNASVVVGVKAKMIPLDSMDIMNRIINKNKDNNFFIKFFRSTTREISFVKDFVLAIDKAKSDALSFSTKGKSSKIWKILERRASKSRVKRVVNTNNSAMAISTLIITADEAEALKKMNNIDMYNPTTAASIMESYNLMAFGIVDDTLETFKILKDNGDYNFETYAYSALEREMSDRTAKAVANVIAKSSR